MSVARARRIAPPSTLGIIGGGALATGFVQAAVRMGYRAAVLDPDPSCPAFAFAHHRLVSAHDDAGALDRLAAECEAVTVAYEGVPAASVSRVATRCAVAPHAESIAVLQDRMREKRFLGALGYPVAPFVPVLSEADLATADVYPGVLKLAEQRTDGEGLADAPDRRTAAAAWRRFGGAPCILERRLAPELELSVVLVRGSDGDVRAYPVAENRHRDGRLELTLAPARIAPVLAARAIDVATRIAHALDYVGVLGVEYFLLDGTLLVNEVAPRAHAAALYTHEACATGQFEQQLRALCGLPLGETGPLSAAATVLLRGPGEGGRALQWRRALAGTRGRLHRYGGGARGPSGHVTFLSSGVADALARAETCLRRLQADSPASSVA